MYYDFDDKLIHDDKAMWYLALSFKTNYNFIKEQVIRAKADGYMSYNGQVISKWDKNYVKILTKYKTELKLMNEIIEFEIKSENSILKKYVKTDL